MPPFLPLIAYALFSFVCTDRVGGVLGLCIWPVQDGVGESRTSSATEHANSAAFGSRLALAGGRLAIGAQPLRRAQALADAVFVFKMENGVWAGEAKISAPPQAHGRLFGRSLALQGSRLLVGAPNSAVHGDVGLAVLYEVSDEGLWEMVHCFEPINPSGGFGYAVALEGGNLVIGGPWGPEHESVEIYGLVEGVWRLRDVIQSPAANVPSGFGAAMALQNGRLAVLAPYASGLPEDAGRISIYGLADDGSMASHAAVELSPQGLRDLTSIAWASGRLMAGGAVYGRSGEACGGIMSFGTGNSGWREEWGLRDSAVGCLGLGRMMVVDGETMVVGFDGMPGYRAGRLQGALLLKVEQSEPFVLQQTVMPLPDAISREWTLVSIDASDQVIAMGCLPIDVQQGGIVLIGAASDFLKGSGMQELRAFE